MASTIRFEQVSLKFPGATRPAVEDCTCQFEAGKLVVILGPSGCGKTTVLKMVNRLYEPTTGTIYLNETNVRRIPVTALRQQMGYVIQQSGLFPHMTVAENIAVVPRLLKWSHPKIQMRIDELLSLVKLSPEEYRDRYPSQLSGGQQQRVGLARALAGDPQVLLMDEPFGAIDAITRTTLQDEILSLQQHLQKTILFVSHDVEEALRLADRILILQEGRIVQYDTPFNILTQPVNAFVSALMGTQDIVRQLGLVRVETVMIRQLDGVSEQPTIDARDNLRNALSLLLRTGDPQLTVVDHNRPVGVLTLDQIRLSARSKPVPWIDDEVPPVKGMRGG